MGSIRTPPNPPSSPPLTKIDDSSSVQECLMSRLVASSVPFSHLFSPVMSTFPGNWKQQPSVVSLWRLATGKIRTVLEFGWMRKKQTKNIQKQETVEEGKRVKNVSVTNFSRKFFYFSCGPNTDAEGAAKGKKMRGL